MQVAEYPLFVRIVADGLNKPKMLIKQIFKNNIKLNSFLR